MLEIAPLLDQQTQLLPYAAVVPPHDNDHYGGETRPLVSRGLIGMVVSLALLSLVFALGATSGAAGLLATICLALYIASFAISLGPVFWLMISEIYPLRIRGTAMSVASIANWGSNFLVALTFPVLLAGLGGAGSFWLFAAVGIVAWFFVYFWVPETKGKPWSR